MRHGSLFSGIGGFDLAAEWMGWENVFHCEWNEFGQKILKHYWPNAISYSDITKTDFSTHANKIDILTGGFPCQPYSTAGKRLGKDDDRHLWPEMLRAIREIQPRWIVGENVPGLLNWERGMVLDEIKADLEAAGFEVLPPLVLPACGLNAPHRRDRLWVVANAKSSNSEQSMYSRNRTNGLTGMGNVKTTANANGFRFNGGECEHEINTGERGKYALNDFKQMGNVTNPNNQGLQGSEINGSTSGIRKDREKQFARLLPPDWQDFPTQPALCGGDDGIPNRVDRIKALGNAIVPQVAFEIFKAIECF